MDFFIDIDKRFEEIQVLLNMLEQVMREQVFYNISPLYGARLSPNVIKSMKKALDKGQFVGTFTNVNKIAEFNTQITHLINHPQWTGGLLYILTLLLIYLKYLPIYLNFERVIIYKDSSGELQKTTQQIFGISIGWSENDYLYFYLYPDGSTLTLPPINYKFSHIKNKDLTNTYTYIPTNLHILTITPPVTFDGTNISEMHYDLTSIDIDLVYTELKKLLKNNVSWDTQLEVELLFDFPLQITRDWDINGGYNVDIIYDEEYIPYFEYRYNESPYYENVDMTSTDVEDTW